MKEELRRIYEDKLSTFNKTKEEVYFIIETFLDKTDIKIHSIQSRIKKFDSLLEKAEGAEITEADKAYEAIRDIVGLRIICLFISDITKIIDLIKENFTIIQEDNKLTESDISSFGYFSAHFICKLKEEYRGPRYDTIKRETFEIQIRTISMDAWANISHYLDYKSEMEVPKDLKKDFFALSGLFYVADTHFEMFFRNKKQQSKIAKDEVEQNVDAEINFETVEAYINNRFKNKEQATPQAISRMTQELIEVGYRKISDLDSSINKAFEKTPEKKRVQELNRIGIVRNALRDIDPTYAKLWEKQRDEFLKKRKK